ncbi:MAG: NAD(+) diphosphatase [Alteromonas sp.]|nr:MAG: NAD(+) diphosphatase [Alteromonas sp.]
MWVVFSRGKIVVQESSESIPVAYLSDIPFLASYVDEIHQLPPLNETAHRDLPVYVVDLGAEHVDEPGWERVSLRQLLFAEYDIAFSVIGRAWQYIHFLRTHQFCGQCGAKTERVDWEMAMHCHRCQHRSYPRVSPCIIVSIHDNEKILLAKGVRHRESNMYSTLAGFVESGESLEQAVHREVFEEVGVKVKNLRYYNSQPWPFPHSLMVGFVAEYDEGEIRCQENEIDDAQWFDIDALPTIPPKVSIAGQLIAETVSLIGDK